MRKDKDEGETEGERDGKKGKEKMSECQRGIIKAGRDDGRRG